MEGLSAIVPFITGNWQKLLTGGMLGAGEIGNILEQKKRADYQNYVMSLLKDPAKLSRMAVATERPLDNALIQSVGNTVQGQMAERGLAQAPGIYASELSQSLAPYAQQNYNTALNAILSTLGLPPQTFANPSDNSGALKLFLSQFQKPSSTPTNQDVGLTPPIFPGQQQTGVPA